MLNHTKKDFKDFTNLYQISKTLRFELKPQGDTSKMLEENEVIEKDKTKKKEYEMTKPYLDRLHREFVRDSLKDREIEGISEYFEIWKNWQKDKKNKEQTKKLDSKQKELRKEIVRLFDSEAKEWVNNYSKFGFKKEDKDFLYEPGIFKVLKEKYGDEKDSFIIDEKEEKVSIFDRWEKFNGYFGKFFETRKNFYKDDGTSTAVATRIIDQNLRRFCENIIIYENIKDKIDFTEAEKEMGANLDEIFKVKFYNSCLLQKGIDNYNKILGGESLEKGKKVKGINEYINLYRQKTGEKIKFLKLLDKQILSEKESTFIETIENDRELFEILEKFIQDSTKRISGFKKLLNDFIETNDDYDLAKIYLSKSALNTIIHRWFSENGLFEEKLFNIISAKETKKWYELRKQKNDSKIKKEEGIYHFPAFVQLRHIKQALDEMSEENSGLKIWKHKYYKEKEDQSQYAVLETGENNNDFWEQFLRVFRAEFNNLFSTQLTHNIPKDKDFDKECEKLSEVEEKLSVDKDKREVKTKAGYEVFLDKIEKSFSEKSKISLKHKIIIKNFVSSVLDIYRMTKYFSLEKKGKWLEEYDTADFYDGQEFGYQKFYRNSYDEIILPFNLVRNYLTKKDYEEEKWKLNFENPTLAAGWDKNKEKGNSAIILRKGGNYYLGIMKKGHNNIFDEDKLKKAEVENAGSDYYEKMVYKYYPGVAKMIPKSSTQVKEVKDYFRQGGEETYRLETDKLIAPLDITKEIFNLNNIQYSKNDLSKEVENGGIKKFQKSYLKLGGKPETYKEALQKWIAFCKDFMAKYKSTKSFDLTEVKEDDEYQSLDQFYKDIDRVTYKLTFRNVPEQYIKQENKKGNLYLFQIKNKDWNKGSVGRKNLHTLYFEALFSKENAENNFIAKLNGQAELFFRPKSDKIEKEKIITKKNKEVLEKGEKAFHKNRFRQKKFLFHVPITLNRVAGEASSRQLNNKINDYLADSDAVKIIGIDRGEKHLAYYSVIDQNGVIVDLGTLNVIDGVDYHEKLEKAAKARLAARKDWQKIEDIKNLKKGYISQVVRKVSDLATKNNAIVVLEDLNMRFKQIRGGIEKSVYQQMEKALIDKLGFLVNKREDNASNAGHVLRAFQLSAPFTTFENMGKQTGIIFYTQAGYTSKTCPKCGFRPNIKFKYGSIEQSKDLLKNLDLFEYDKNKDRFIIKYSLSNFKNKQNNKKEKENVLYKNIKPKDTFEIYSNVIRHKWKNKRIKSEVLPKGVIIHGSTEKGTILRYDITKFLKSLFDNNNIDYSRNLQKQLVDNKLDSRFFKDLLYGLFLMINIRDSISSETGPESDKISCPSCLFDSTDGFQSKEFNGDANGAYNVARKGKIILDKIKQYKHDHGSVEKLSWGDLYVDNEEWDKFTQKK